MPSLGSLQCDSPGLKSCTRFVPIGSSFPPPLLSLDDVFSKSCLFCTFQLGNPCPCQREEKQERSHAACPVIGQHYIICSWPLFLHCFWSLSNFQKALALPLAFSASLGVLWDLTSPARFLRVCVTPLSLSLTVCPFYLQQNTMLPLIFYLAASSVAPNWGIFHLRVSGYETLHSVFLALVLSLHKPRRTISE